MMIRISSRARWITLLIALVMAVSSFFYFGYKVRDVGFTAYYWITGKQVFTDWGCVTTTVVSAIKYPQTVEEIAHILHEARQHSKKVSIAGARYCQGGQNAYPDGIVIDMRHINKVVHLDVDTKKVTIQAGSIWRELQEYIDPYNLSVKEMQSYNDFSIGGALSVNAHGRDTGQGQLIETVDAITVMLADGKLMRASRFENRDIFDAVVGGYGMIGVIIDVTLALTDNYKIAPLVRRMHIDQYYDFYFNDIAHNKKVVLQNANVYPPNFEDVVSVAWEKTNEPLTIRQRLQEEKKLYVLDVLTVQALRTVPQTQGVRKNIELRSLDRGDVVMRNFETSYRTKVLEPFLCVPTTYILEEYFVPCARLNEFVNSLRTTMQKYKVNIMNCSIRHVSGCDESYMTYAPHDVFAFVLYINILNTPSGQEYSGVWTRELIDAALALGGTYYLPYQLHATREQMHKAYPGFERLLAVKKLYDLQGLFSNRLLEKYY